MTLSPFIIYLWGIADNLRFGFGAVVWVGLGVSIFLALFINIERGGFDTAEAKPFVRTFYKTVCVMMLCGFCNTVTPSSKTIAIMVVAPAIVNSKPIQQDLPEVYSLAVDALKQSLKDAAIEQTK